MEFSMLFTQFGLMNLIFTLSRPTYLQRRELCFGGFVQKTNKQQNKQKQTNKKQKRKGGEGGGGHEKKKKEKLWFSSKD